MYKKHLTQQVEGATGENSKVDDLRWNVTLLVDADIHSNIFTVERPTKFQALQAAWVQVRENQEKYGIENWEHGRLAIEVSRSE